MALDPSRTQLLVIDFQERLFGAMAPLARERARKAADNLIFTARELGVPVDFTEQYPQGLGRTLPELGAVDPFEKMAFAATDEAGFAARLTRPHVVLCGMEAHICVAHTAVGLRARGLEVTVAWDACVSRRDEDAQVGMDWVRARGGEILSSETLMFGWLGRAEGALFKAVSKRIR